MTTLTPNLRLAKPNFNVATWHDQVNENWDRIDAAIGTLPGAAIDGDWDNSIAYAVDDRIFDTDNNEIYRCAVAHTSAAAGTFAADRTLHPTYWSLVDTGLSIRGAWATATLYIIGDVAYDVAAGLTGVAKVQHTSGASMTADAANWDFIVNNNIGTAINAAPTTTTVDAADEIGFYDSVTASLRKMTFPNWLVALGVRINALTTKATPVDADELLLADSAASNGNKKLTWANLKTVMFAALGPLIAAATGKTTPADADGVLITDSAAGGINKFLSFANLRIGALKGLVVRVQVFAASGTYTPHANMVYALGGCIGAGGGGGGVANSGAATQYNAGGGGSGGLSLKSMSKADVGASQVVTCGAGGTAGSNAGGTGGDGGDTSIGTLCIAKGGKGGVGSSTATHAIGGLGGVADTGDIAFAGTPGEAGTGAPQITTIMKSGNGGASPLGGGGRGGFSGTAPTVGTKGGGGGGAGSIAAGGALAGAGGGTGFAFVIEFCSA